MEKMVEKHEVNEALDQLHSYFKNKVETKQGKDKVDSVFSYLRGLIDL